MIKKILLIITPSTNFKEEKVSFRESVSEHIPQPLGVCYLGALLRNKGYDVEVYNAHVDCFEEYNKNRDIEILKSDILEKINTTNFDVLGISSPYIYTYEWAHFIAKTAKAKNNDLPVVIGGGYPSLLLDKVLDDRNIDYLIIGEAEISFLKLLDYFQTKNEKDLLDIDGIGYRQNGAVIVRPIKTYITDVDSIPLPAWDLIDLEKYMKVYGKRTLVIITSRGCPYSCTFCNSYKTWGRGFRKRSAANILAEIDYAIDNFGVKDFLFADDNMTVDKKRFMELAAAIKQRNITWNTVNISSFTTDEEMLRAMKGSGCDSTAIAVESAVPKTLKALRKPVDLEKTKELVKLCRKVGLTIKLLYIAGLPYDNKEDMLTTFKYSEEVRADWNQYSMLVPYPGTDIYEYCKEKGYFIDENLDLSQFTIHNKSFIETETWDREWVADITYDYNIKTNFLRNYNITEDDGKLETAINWFEYVAKYFPEHVIALMCLAYAYNKKGHMKKSEELLKQAYKLFEQESVHETYGKYLTWDEEVINFYKSWTNNYSEKQLL